MGSKVTHGKYSFGRLHVILVKRRSSVLDEADKDFVQVKT